MDPRTRKSTPTVSVGLAVYNGEQYVREAIEGVLAQSYQDFELIISDNASRDGSYDICAEYAAKDPRVRLYRNKTNLGAAPNFNRLFELGRGRYFKWAFHDDVMLPRFLSAVVGVLEADDSVVCCMTGSRMVGPAGELLGHREAEPRWGDARRRQRLLGALAGNRMPVHGLARVSALRRTALHGSFADSDGNLIAELAMQGRIVEVPEQLYLHRIHPEKSTVRFRNPRDRQEFYDTTCPRAALTPTVASLSAHVRSVIRLVSSWTERLMLLATVGGWYLVHRPRHIIGDLRTLAVPAGHRPVSDRRRSRIGTRSGSRPSQPSTAVRSMPPTGVPGSTPVVPVDDR